MFSPRLGLHFVALTTLLLELTLIRIFDYLWFPNMAWMVITLAMFSIGVSGVLVSLRPVEHHRHFGAIVTAATLLMAASCLLILPMLSELRFNYMHISEEPVQALARFLGILATIALPFLLGGLVISALFSRFADRIQSLYFWDLAGAALGCVAVVAAVEYYGAPGLLVLCAATALLAAACFVRRRTLMLALVVAAVAVGIEPLMRDELHEIRSHMNKRGFAWLVVQDKVEKTTWDPVSRIDVIDYRSGIKWIAYDGGTQTSYYYKFNGDYAALRENIDTRVTEHFWGPIVLASHILKRDTHQDVLVIGAAGGQESKAALTFGANHVDAVELVGSVIEMGKTEYDEWLGGTYNDPRVNAVRGEGRSFLRATDRRYDIIQMMSNHTSSSLAAGSGAMSPAYLQTVEAYREYFNHLADDGILHINHHLYPRMVATAARAWAESGRRDFRRHVLVVESREHPDNLPTMMIRMSPWTAEDVAEVQRILDNGGTTHMPVNPLDASASYLPAEFYSGELSQATLDRLPYHVQAPTDDKPFFNFIRKHLAEQPEDDAVLVNKSVEFLLNKRREAGLPLDVLHLFVTGGASILFAAIVLGVPLLFSRTGRTRWSGKASFMAYFACLGAGFIIIELVLIQMFMKLIGYPTYTYATAVFSMLLGAGLGSAFSARLDIRRLSSLRLPFAGAITCILLVLLSRDAVFDLALTAPLAVRMLVATAMLAPVGFFLGMPFPIGITLAKDKPAGTVAWCWAMNGLTTIIGGLVSVVVSLYLGFTVTILGAVGLYLLASLLLGTMFRATERVPASSTATLPAGA